MLSLYNGYLWVSTVVCNDTPILNGLNGSTEEWFSFPQLQLMVITPGVSWDVEHRCQSRMPSRSV